MAKTAFAAAFLLSLALLGAVSANFEARSLDVAISLNPDGSAHVQETLQMFINGQQYIDLYESSVVFNDLSSWRTRTGLEDLQNHITRAAVSFESFRIRPQPVERCNLVSQTCFASLVWEYDITPIEPNASGILKMESYKPRTTLYSLNTAALNFPLSKTGDIILAKGTSLRFEMPSDAAKIFFSKLPSNLAENSTDFRFDMKTNRRFYSGPLRAFEWSGETLPQFELSYEREEPLEKEIIDFFAGFQNGIFDALRSSEGGAIILLCLLFVVSAVSLHTVSRSPS
jgi:hypothetical protein